MQKNIAFYISDHNMEHALRNIPIINTILKMENSLQLYVKSGKEQIDFIKSQVDEKERLRLCAMEMMDQRTENWDNLAEEEKIFLKEEGIGLVVSDICPWIFLAADELRIKSLLLANYTWADLCKEEEEKEDYLECYELASKMFIYDLYSPDMTGYGVEYELISMMNRPYSMEKIESIHSAYELPLVFADIAGNFDVSGLPYHFLVAGEKEWRGENITYLPDDTDNLQDYVAASKYVIADAAWNRISEILLANKTAALIGREDLPMGREMVGILKKRQQCIEILPDELSDIGSVLARLEQFTYSYEYEYYNSDYDMAKKILFAYPEKRRRNRS